jgi:hypothetical protein
MRRFVFAASCSVLLALAPLTACSDDDGVPAGIDGDLLPIDGSPGPDSPVADADPNAPDADPNAPDADLTAPDGMPASTIDGAVGISCGDTMTCTGTDECCVTNNGGTAEFNCVAMGTCQGASLACDGPEDCTGNACCLSGGGGGGSAECSDATTCMGAALTLCHTDNECPAPQGGGAPKCCPQTQFGSTQYCLPIGTTCF